MNESVKHALMSLMPKKQGRVLEVGSRDVNGSVSHLFDDYTGCDMIDGPNVDVVCSADHLIETFGSESFDLVICLETLEHIRDWQWAIYNIKSVTKKGGFIIVSAPAPHFKYHPHPRDYWRFTPQDWMDIFKDMAVVGMVRTDPGYMVKVMRTQYVGLLGMKVYSVLTKKKSYQHQIWWMDHRLGHWFRNLHRSGRKLLVDIKNTIIVWGFALLVALFIWVLIIHIKLL